MNKNKKGIFRTAIAMMLAVLLVITAGCSADETPQGSDINISEIEGESSAVDSSAEESEGNEEPENTSSGADDSSAGGESSSSAEKEDLVIETPFVNLYYPGEWAPFLEIRTTDGDVYIVDFIAKLDSGKQLELFSIIFGSEEDVAGTVEAPNGKEVNVSIEIKEISSEENLSKDEKDIVFSMMDALNKVIEKMELKAAENEPGKEDGNSSGNSSRPGTSELPPEMAADMVLDTPYGELHYPSAWADYLTIDVSENGKTYIVEFGCKIGDHEKMALFTVYLGGNEGYEIGKIKQETGEYVSVKVSVSELSFGSDWSQDEISIANAMQEDINYVISKLG